VASAAIRGQQVQQHVASSGWPVLSACNGQCNAARVHRQRLERSNDYCAPLKMTFFNSVRGVCSAGLAAFAEALTEASADAADGCTERALLRLEDCADLPRDAELFPAGAPCASLRMSVRGVSPSALAPTRGALARAFPAERSEAVVDLLADAALLVGNNWLGGHGAAQHRSCECTGQCSGWAWTAQHSTARASAWVSAVSAVVGLARRSTAWLVRVHGSAQSVQSELGHRSVRITTQIVVIINSKVAVLVTQTNKQTGSFGQAKQARVRRDDPTKQTARWRPSVTALASHTAGVRWCVAPRVEWGAGGLV
jgi:hypothetical protein